MKKNSKHIETNTYNTFSVNTERKRIKVCIPNTMLKGFKKYIKCKILIIFLN